MLRVSLILSLFCGQSAVAAQWGAIASTYDTLRETHVIGSSRNESLQEVVQVCRKQNPGQDCFAVAAVEDGCVAWAVDRRGHWGWAHARGVRSPDMMQMLEKKAVDSCRRDPDAGRCRLVRTVCTDEQDS